jgi:hypothetical protein
MAHEYDMKAAREYAESLARLLGIYGKTGQGVFIGAGGFDGRELLVVGLVASTQLKNEAGMGRRGASITIEFVNAAFDFGKVPEK